MWANPGSMAQIKASNPELASQIEELTPVVRAYNLLMEAKEIGIMISADKLDVETVRLVYLMKTKIMDREARKATAKQGAKRRGR